MKPDTLLIEMRSAADALQFDALHARAVEAGAVRLTAKGAATLSDLLTRAADALDEGSSRTEERDRLAEQAGYAIGYRLRDALSAASSQAEAITLLCDALADAAEHPASLNGFAVSLLPVLFTDKEA